MRGHRKIIGSLDHVLYVHFVYVYLMDCSLFALILRALTQLPQSATMVSKSLRRTFLYILGINVVFIVKHFAVPEPPSLIIDFFGQSHRTSRRFLMCMDLVITMLQLVRALVMQSSLVEAPPGTARSLIRQKRADARRAANAATAAAVSTSGRPATGSDSMIGAEQRSNGFGLGIGFFEAATGHTGSAAAFIGRGDASSNASPRRVEGAASDADLANRYSAAGGPSQQGGNQPRIAATTGTLTASAENLRARAAVLDEGASFLSAEGEPGQEDEEGEDPFRVPE
ncbi:hypothetical protein DFJ73DRAFT_797277, partial [Zopfochytrium polystomum]